LVETLQQWGVNTVFGLPGDVRGTLAAALASDKPAIVEVVVDANEPPMPSKVTVQQAVKFGRALLSGQPDGPRIALTIFLDRVEELVR
jgi:pyruvate dehydrogenase (quinone)/pyruvate oxidase